MLKVPEVADRLGVSVSTAWRLLALGEMQRVYVKSAVRVPEQSIAAYIERQTSPKEVAS